MGTFIEIKTMAPDARFDKDRRPIIEPMQGGPAWAV